MHLSRVTTLFIRVKTAGLMSPTLPGLTQSASKGTDNVFVFM